MIVFIPQGDYSTSAAAASIVDRLDFGYVRPNDTINKSIRIGNRGAETVTLSLTIRPPMIFSEVYVYPTNVSLSPDATSDTISLTVSAPTDATPEVVTGELVATDQDGNAYTLPFGFSSVGPNANRGGQYPQRIGSITDNFSGIIAKLGEPFTLYRFDPVAYDPNDDTILVRFAPGARHLAGEAGDHTFLTNRDIACRLDPLNQRWGYRQSDRTITGAFIDETYDLTDLVTWDNSTTTYSGHARLVVGAEFEDDLLRQWALFAEARASDVTQFKRTVLLFQRQGVAWAISSIYSLYFGNDIVAFVCDLIAINDPSSGSPKHYNPFGQTFEYESDKVYATYPVGSDVHFVLPPDEYV